MLAVSTAGRSQTKVFPSSMMKRYEFLKLKFQGKHKKVYKHQLEHAIRYLSLIDAISQAVMILRAVYGIKEVG